MIIERTCRLEDATSGNTEQLEATSSNSQRSEVKAFRQQEATGSNSQQHAATRLAPELSTRTSCTFAREFSSFQAAMAATGERRCPGHGSARLLGRPRDPLLRGRRLQTRGPRDPVVGRRSGRPGHAAASTDGQVAHDAERLASPRVRRAASARAVSSVGTASPVPKYISASGGRATDVSGSATMLRSWSSRTSVP